MGYFSNGTEGALYEDKYCSRCVHHDGPDGKSGCPVWLAHLIFNYSECGKGTNAEQILGLLIPSDKEGWNEQCSMFHARTQDEKPEQPIQPMQAMREWARERGLCR